MKKLLLLIPALAVITFCSFVFTDRNAPTTVAGDDAPNGPTGKTVVYNGKYIFIMTTPVTPFTVIDKAKPDDKGMTMTMQILGTVDDAIKKEGKGKMEKFDAVIVHGQYKSMEFIKYTGTEGVGEGYPFIYETKKLGVKYVYFGLVPNKGYDVVQTFDKGALGQTGIGVANNAADPYIVKINSFCEKSGRVAKESNLVYDGLIVSQNAAITTDVFLANDFGENVQMIKFK